MNWLLYLGGWWLGIIVIDFISKPLPEESKDIGMWIRLLSWTAVWIWICWKSI